MHILKRTDGFTLVEVMIGTVVLTIIALGLMQVSVSAIRGNAFSMKMTTATTLAQDRLERVKRLGYANAPTVAGTETYSTITNFAGFQRETVVENDTPLPAVRTVTVTVSWKPETSAVALSTIIAE